MPEDCIPVTTLRALVGHWRRVLTHIHAPEEDLAWCIYGLEALCGRDPVYASSPMQDGLHTARDDERAG